MSKANPSGADSGKPLPHCKAFLLCEEVTENDLTGAISLVNLIEAVQLSEFPGVLGQFVLFLQLYDGIGRYAVSLELHDLADDRVVSAGLHEVDFPNRLDKIDLVVPIDSMRLPHSGRYEWAVLLDGNEVATQYFDAEVDHGEQEDG